MIKLYIPQDVHGNNMTCANNCRGVNPNAVVIGGTAALAAAAVTPLQVIDQGSWDYIHSPLYALFRCSRQLGSEHFLLLEVELPLLVREQPEDVNRVDHVG